MDDYCYVLMHVDGCLPGQVVEYLKGAEIEIEPTIVTLPRGDFE
jgi:hypothetical protein